MPEFSPMPGARGNQHPLRVAVVGNSTAQSSSSLMRGNSLNFSAVGALSIGWSSNSLAFSINSSLSNIRISAGTTSNLLSALTFSNINNVSFGLNGSTLTASISTSLTNINVSAGTTSNNLSALTFSNANNVSFGLNGSTLTATVTVATSLTNINVSAGTTSNNLSALTFSNANNVSFGLNGSTLTATVTVATSLTNINVSAGTTSNNLSAVTFSNSNGLSFGLNGSTVTGSYTVPTVTNSSMTVSDAATSGTLARLAFTNLNGVTLSLSTGAGGSHTIVGSHNAITSQSTQFLAMTLGGNTAGTTTFHATNNVSLFFNGGNNITLSGNGSTVTISAANQTNQTIGGYAVSNTTGQSSSSTLDARTVSFHGAGNVSVGYSGGSIVISGGTAAPSPVNFSAGTTSGNLGSVVFSDSNRVSFGLNGSTITAKHALNFSAGTTSNNISDGVTFSDSNGISFGINGSTITASANTVGTATTVYPVATANSVGTVSRWAAEDHRHSIPAPASYWRNAAAELLGQTQTLTVAQSTSYIQPFVLNNNVSVSYIRFLQSLGVGNTTSIATSVNATGSCSIFSTLWAMIYSQNTGASSLSLVSVASASAGVTQVWSLSANANGSQWTLSQSITHPITGGTSSFTTGVTTSLSNYSLGSLSLTRFTGLQFVDLLCETLLTEGNYWLMHGLSSTTSTGGIAAMTQLRMSNSMIAASQINSSIRWFGQTAVASIQIQPGIGSFSTNAIGTTASLGFSNISSSASHPMMPFHFHRTT